MELLFAFAPSLLIGAEIIISSRTTVAVCDDYDRAFEEGYSEGMRNAVWLMRGVCDVLDKK